MNPATTILNFNALYDWAEVSRTAYANAVPFPHIVHPSFLDPDALAAVVDEFPNPDQLNDWRKLSSLDGKGRVAQSEKLGYSNELAFGPTIRTLLYELNSGPFLQILERITGISGLMPDPYLMGGGLHQYLPGAILRVHADFNMHPLWKLDRRLNLLLYLNENWQPEWGGELELWDRSMSRCVERVMPSANTCVIFSTTSESFHGMPDPLRCPKGRTRKSIAIYYYSTDQQDQRQGQPTLWQVRPHE
jgi:Rps23 Pro-64 3,4-dihydroxylase Tpa1-like proline 4-hydroxylase